MLCRVTDPSSVPQSPSETGTIPLSVNGIWATLSLFGSWKSLSQHDLGSTQAAPQGGLTLQRSHTPGPTLAHTQSSPTAQLSPPGTHQLQPRHLPVLCIDPQLNLIILLALVSPKVPPEGSRESTGSRWEGVTGCCETQLLQNPGHSCPHPSPLPTSAKLSP